MAFRVRVLKHPFPSISESVLLEESHYLGSVIGIVRLNVFNFTLLTSCSSSLSIACACTWLLKVQALLSGVRYLFACIPNPCHRVD